MRYWLLAVMLLAFVFVNPNQSFAKPKANATTRTVVFAPGQKGAILARGFNHAEILVHRRSDTVATPSCFRFEIGVSGGLLGAGTKYRVWAAMAEAAVEYRLKSWLGVYAFGGGGGTGGLFEGDANSVILGGVGAALWPADYVRIVLGGGGITVRNPSWNDSYVGPMGLAKLDFLLGSGFGLGATALVGSGWTWWGDLSTGWLVTAGVRWHFGGKRE